MLKLVDVYSKGKVKVKQNFSRMLYAKYNVLVDNASELEVSDV